jgi:hypothetical protein
MMIVIFVASQIADADSSGYASALGSVAMALVAGRSRVARCPGQSGSSPGASELLHPAQSSHPSPEIAVDFKDIIIFHESNYYPITVAARSKE